MGGAGARCSGEGRGGARVRGRGGFGPRRDRGPAVRRRVSAGPRQGVYVYAIAERTTRRTGGKRCDVEIRRKHDDRYYTAMECKIG